PRNLYRRTGDCHRPGRPPGRIRSLFFGQARRAGGRRPGILVRDTQARGAHRAGARPRDRNLPVAGGPELSTISSGGLAAGRGGRLSDPGLAEPAALRRRPTAPATEPGERAGLPDHLPDPADADAATSAAARGPVATDLSSVPQSPVSGGQW